MLDKLEEEELFDDFDEAPEVFEKAAEKWLIRNRNRAEHYIIPRYGQPIKVVHEKVEATGSEQRKILHYLKDEIVKRMDAYGRYNIKAVDEAVAWKLLGGKPKHAGQYLLDHPEKHLEFADALAKVEAVHDRLMGGRYVPTPHIAYTAVDTKPKKASKKIAAALGLLMAGAAVAGIAGMWLRQQGTQTGNGGQPTDGSHPSDGQPSNGTQTGGGSGGGQPSNGGSGGGGQPGNGTQTGGGSGGGQPVEPADTTPPSLSADYKFFAPDKLMVTAAASDASGIREVLAEAFGRNHTMTAVNGRYAVNITDGNLHSLDKAAVRVIAFDNKGNFAFQQLYAVPGIEDKFVSYAMANGLDEGSARQFYAAYESLVKQLYPGKAELLLPCVGLNAKNATIFGELHRNISNDKQIS
ncbi:MAG: hypothetical protein QXY34_01530, partial [Candidatus Bathyarchaeia archaeon]